MKCERCGKEFDDVSSSIDEQWDRGDGIMYGNCSSTYNPVCPQCGYYNGPAIYNYETTEYFNVLG